MTEESELQAKIDALSGKINNHKLQQQSSNQYSPEQSKPWIRGRWTPYGRAGRSTYARSFKNRTLHVVGNQTPSPSRQTTPSSFVDNASHADQPETRNAFVSTRGRGNNSLMNRVTYEREQKQKVTQIEQSRSAKQQKAFNQETIALAAAMKAQNDRILTIDGLKYQLREDGVKLFRVSGISGRNGRVCLPADKLMVIDTSGRETPKKLTIAGVDFYRTKTGNLVRAKAVQQLARSTPRKKTSAQCPQFAKHGTCSQGPACKFTHDPEKVAVCKTFLHKGTCPSVDHCDLSHDLTYHRVPACTHFLRGNCTNDNCRYPHVHVSPTAPVCKPFASLGYCAEGPKCNKRHMVECADYANSGYCADRENGKCPLPHIDRAATLRKAGDPQKQVALGDVSDASSPSGGEDVDMEDIDSEAEEIILGGFNDTQSMAQQHDFVPLA